MTFLTPAGPRVLSPRMFVSSVVFPQLWRPRHSTRTRRGTIHLRTAYRASVSHHDPGSAGVAAEGGGSVIPACTAQRRYSIDTRNAPPHRTPPSPGHRPPLERGRNRSGRTGRFSTRSVRCLASGVCHPPLPPPSTTCLTSPAEGRRHLHWQQDMSHNSSVGLTTPL